MAGARLPLGAVCARERRDPMIRLVVRASHGDRDLTGERNPLKSWSGCRWGHRRRSAQSAGWRSPLSTPFFSKVVARRILEVCLRAPPAS